MDTNTASAAPIDVVVEAFVVICSFAVAQFFTDGGTVVDQDPAFRTSDAQPEPEHNPWYWACYAFSLTALVTLVLRFLAGSHEQLKNGYPVLKNRQDFDGFLIDVSFLMVFGALLARTALTKTVRAFVAGLAGISAIGVLWSFIECVIRSERVIRSELQLGWWWLGVNLVQLVLTFALVKCCPPRGSRANVGAKKVRAVLSIAAAWFCLAFYFDLQEIVYKKIELWGHIFLQR